MRITASDFEAWWGNPVGDEFRKMLKEDLDKLSHGNMTESFARDHIHNAIQVGRYERTMEIYKLNFEALMGDGSE